MKKEKFTPSIAINENGEIIGIVIPPNRTNVKKEDNFYMSDKELSIKLAKDKELRGQTMSVLLYMLGSIENGNRVLLSQKKISKILEMHRVSVSEAIKKLIKKEIILKDTESDVSGAYIFNPDYFWNGKRHEIKNKLNQKNNAKNDYLGKETTTKKTKAA